MTVDIMLDPVAIGIFAVLLPVFLDIRKRLRAMELYLASRFQYGDV